MSKDICLGHVHLCDSTRQKAPETLLLASRILGSIFLQLSMHDNEVIEKTDHRIDWLDGNVDICLVRYYSITCYNR